MSSSSSSDLFMAATRAKLRFATPQGSMTIEDLWSLPLTSEKANTANLDSIAIELNRQIQAAGVTSFVTKTSKTPTTLQMQLNVVVAIIAVRQEENEHKALLATRREQAQRAQQILDERAGKALENLSDEDLKLLASRA